MCVIVRFLGMTVMVVVVGAVISGMVVVMNRGIGSVIVVMRVNVGVIVRMGVFMLMRVCFPAVSVLVGMGVSVFVIVLMGMLVTAFHGITPPRERSGFVVGTLSSLRRYEWSEIMSIIWHSYLARATERARHRRSVALDGTIRRRRHTAVRALRIFTYRATRRVS